MIYPVPPRVDPNTHQCGCGARLTMPYVASLGGNALRCTVNPDHDSWKIKQIYSGKRTLADGKEYDIMSQREETALAPITDHATALASVRQSITFGQFSGRQTEAQIELIATLALAYRLDPMQEEIIPMYGKPFITIKGRRRLDNAAGNIFGLEWKIPNREFLDYYEGVGAIDPGDVIAIAVGTFPGKDALKQTVWARCKVHEVAGNDAHLPINAWKLEMAQKRAERRLRESMFGPVPRPKGVEHIDIDFEGDDPDHPNAIEGTSHVMDDGPATPTKETPVRQAAREAEELILAQGDLGRCPEHDEPWRVSYSDRYKKIQAAHKITDSGDWHHFGSANHPILNAAYKAKYGEDSKKADCDNWLKEQFNGNTWSTMEPRDMVKAIHMLTVDTATGALSDPVPPDDDPRPICGICEKRVDDDDPGEMNHKACMDAEDERQAAVTA